VSEPGALLRGLRVHQWLKNLLVYLPLVTSHRLVEGSRVAAATLAFVSFCLAAAAGYLLNDVIDAPIDRVDPLKSRRPVASGRLRPVVAVWCSAGLAAAGLAVARATLTGAFTITLAVYLALAASYSLRLKGVVVLDVLLLAGLYCLRVIAGGMATSTFVSPWLLGFSMFFFLSLAVLKRYAELRGADAHGPRSISHPYTQEDADLLGTVGPVSGYLSVLVLAFYINSQAAHELYRSPNLLWLLGPLLIYWITRLWLLVHRGAVPGDPVLFAARDPVTYVMGCLVALVLVVGSVGLPIRS
jgi:4-hydroxybenzoate polyprenyltransferase